MKLEFSFEALDHLRQRMGARLRPWRADISLEKLADLPFPSDVEVETSDLGTLQVGEAKTILRDGQRVFLYIREFNVAAGSFDEACADPSNLRKFHVVWCKALLQMKAEGRFARYISSDKVDTPFGVALHLQNGDWACGETELHVCRFCLAETNWEGYQASTAQRRAEIVKRFSRRRFLETNHTRFAEIPEKTDRDAPVAGYAEDWKDRSHQYRAMMQYRCEDCGVDCSSRRHLLDTHHLNGVKNDNRNNNLRALCKVCHGKRHPNWYKISEQDRNSLEALRQEQARAGR